MPDVGRRLTELRLVAGTTVRNLQDDPLGFALLIGRRFAPVLRGRLPQDGDGLPAALGAYFADRRDAAASSLRARGRGSRAVDRLAARLAVAVGAEDAIPARLRSDARVRSDLAWERGELTESVRLLAGSRALVARRRASELALLQPGVRLPTGSHPSTDPSGGPVRDTRVSAETTDSSAMTPGRQAGGDVGAEHPRVLHVLTNSLPHTRSGYTARTHALLKASRNAGIEVCGVTRIGYPTTIGRLGIRPFDIVDGIEYHRLLTLSLPVESAARLEAQVRALDSLVAEFAPDVLHTTTDVTNALVVEALARRHGLPWVYEMRGQLELTWVASRPEPDRERAASSERVRLLRAKEAELAAAADGVVVLSQVQADDLFSRGVPAEKIVVVPNGIDASLLDRSATPADARAALGLARGGVWAGTVSSLVDYEGLDTFLRALAEVRTRGVDLRGAIVGDGVSRPGLIALAADLGVSDVVEFPGRVSAADAVRWHEALDVFVVPRRDTPVCRVVTPLKPVEAMALGRPVVASDLPALREVGAASGMLAPASDVVAWASRLEQLARDENLRVTLGNRGRDVARARTWEHGAMTYRSLYAEARHRHG